MRLPLTTTILALTLPLLTYAHPAPTTADATTLTPTPTSRPYILDHNPELESTWESSIAPIPVSRIERWPDRIPLDCAHEASQPIGDGNSNIRCALSHLLVHVVWFADAPDGWVVCRCNDTEFSEERMHQDMGRLDVGTRQHVRYFMGFRDGGGAAGTATAGNDVILFGAGVLLYHHEAAHVMDQGNIHSNTPHFLSAVARDSCWVTEYAKQNGEHDPIWEHEVWAEVFTLHVYRRRVGRLPVHVQCAEHQFWALAEQVDGLIDGAYDRNIKRPMGAIGSRKEMMRLYGAHGHNRGGTGVHPRGVVEDAREVCRGYRWKS